MLATLKLIFGNLHLRTRVGAAVFLIAAALPVLPLLSSCAQAAATATPDVDVSTAAIVVIKKSLAARFKLLKTHLDSGAIGLTHDGLIAIRDLQAIQLTETLKVEAIIAEENKDRASLYREIARANGRPDWESDLKSTFAERWISRAAPGWYHRDSAGKWIRKM
jgi:uncharacterized protein